jgi:hypothetical protein
MTADDSFDSFFIHDPIFDKFDHQMRETDGLWPTSNQQSQRKTKTTISSMIIAKPTKHYFKEQIGRD